MTHQISMMMMQEVARGVAAYYAKRVSWAEFNDVEQAAWVGVLEARATFLPDKGEFRQYAWTAGAKHAQRLLYQQRSPVSAGGRNRGRALLGDAIRIPEEALQWFGIEDSTEAKLLRAHEECIIREALAEGSASMTPACRGAALAVLTEDRTPREVADEFGITAEQASWATRRLRAAVKANAKVIALR